MSGGVKNLMRAAPALALLLLGACASTPAGQPDLLAFIEDGRTTREQALLALGEPSATYEEGRILAFRLGSDKGGYFLLEKQPGFLSVTYSLMLAFDEAGLLRRHSLVALRAP
ncbi:MAG: hypothetical protein MUC71_06155 [Steroidobacteraceae bacterium]|jgi:hypothetical protein|nr:hypothetical protein [Steroidobacteraceae bacterium]